MKIASSFMHHYEMARRINRITRSRVVIVGLLFGTLVWSQFATANMLFHIEVVTPRVGQRGTTVELLIQGACLANPREVVFYRPGIRAIEIEALPKLQYPQGRAHGGRAEEQVRCRFEIAPDCPLGEHPFRIRTATDLTSLATFQVTPFPVVDENEKGNNSNDTLETALPVTPNVSVRGRIGPSNRGDVDLYRVPAVAGGRLSVEVDSVRIAEDHYGGSEFDLAVRILDETGRELASNDDSALHVQDPLIAVKLPRDGVAYVEVRRSLYTSDDRPYCVHIGTNRRPLAIYPPGGPVGTQVNVKLLGDPLGELTETLEVPAKAGNFEYFGDAPSALTLRAAAFGNVLEDVDTPETRVSQLPIAVNGIISEPGDIDGFRLSVKKSDRLRVRVFARTLGSPIDPAIRIRRVPTTRSDVSDKTQNVAGKQDATGDAIELVADDATLNDRDIFGTGFRAGGGLKDVLDPSVIWQPAADGDYILEVYDTLGLGSATGVYRVEIEPAVDSVHVLLRSTAFDWVECMRVQNLAVPQGNRWTVTVSLPQGQGSKFQGELELVAQGLPPGVRCIVPRVQAGQMAVPVQFLADATAQPGTARILLEARPVDTTQKIETSCQQALPFINHSGGDAWRTVRLDRFVLAVTDTAPFTISIAPLSAALVQGGELAIPIKITRRPGFNEPIEFQCEWLPKGVNGPPAATIASGENEAVLRVSAEPQAPVGKWPFVVIASTTQGNGHPYLGAGIIRVSSEMVELPIAEPFVILASRPESVRRGDHARFLWNVQQKNPFEGSAQVRLLGLPKGVRVVEPLPTLTKTSTEVVFDIEASDEALLGRVSGLSCELIVRSGGQEIRQRTGNGTLRIDPAKVSTP
ncbi:MAG: peptidase domain protein [Planctomycetaceae bacterium]|nr:peptidase domain protein [Planctomycetaceae bacterium]